MSGMTWCPACNGEGRTPEEPRCGVCRGLRLIVDEDEEWQAPTKTGATSPNTTTS